MKIKFRVWDINDRVFCFIDELLFSTGDSQSRHLDGISRYVGNLSSKNVEYYKHGNHTRPIYKTHLEKDRYVIQQYTNLKDSYGKDIYDGDICECNKPNSYLDGQYEVAWHETKGRWYYKNQPSHKDFYQVGCQGSTSCKVIGNIFEGIK